MPASRIASTPLALGLFLVSSLSIHAQQEETVSQAAHDDLRQEVEALRAEVERLKAEREGPPVEAGLDPAREDVGRFAPVDPSKQVTTWDRNLTFTSADERFSMNLRGRIQPRYEYERAEDEANRSSFFLRRVRLDFRGHAHTKDLSWRIMPELARTANLRDAWVNVRRHDALEYRFGQYQVPFAWERDVSSDRHQFVERSTANNEFEWADGRDIGLMFHGKPAEKVRYGAGVFGGEGRNVARTSTDGHLFVGRVTYTPIGRYPDSEALLLPVQGRNLALGLGAGYANKNAARDWHSWSAGNQAADVFGATADAHFQVDRFSGHLTGFYRDVDPRQGASSYEGYGFTVQTGYLLIPNRLFGSLRYSSSEPNTDESQGREREIIAGLQVYQFGHGAKVHFEAGRLQRHNGNDWLDTDVFRTQYQMLF